MAATLESVIPTSDGVFFLRDVSAETAEALGSAFDAARIPGSRGGRLFGAAGAVLLVRCAYQYSHPYLRLEVRDSAPSVAEPPWQWEQPTSLDLPTGRLRVDIGEGAPPAELLDIDAGAGPGTYGLILGHTGRTEILQRQRRVSAETLHADVETEAAARRTLHGIERYVVRIWPR